MDTEIVIESLHQTQHCFIPPCGRIAERPSMANVPGSSSSATIGNTATGQISWRPQPCVQPQDPNLIAGRERVNFSKFNTTEALR
eukprot:2038977-Amphidinium_carterae.1